MDYVLLGAITIHTLAMILVVGYYGILGRVILPTLRKAQDGRTMATTLVAMERRALPLVGVAIILFIVTGSYLLLNDDEYAGLGNVLASTWTTLMLVKHLVVVVMVVIGFGLDRLVMTVVDAPDDDARRWSFDLVGLAAEAMTGLGALVVLLTAAAQLS